MHTQTSVRWTSTLETAMITERSGTSRGTARHVAVSCTVAAEATVTGLTQGTSVSPLVSTDLLQDLGVSKA